MTRLFLIEVSKNRFAIIQESEHQAPLVQIVTLILETQVQMNNGKTSVTQFLACLSFAGTCYSVIYIGLGAQSVQISTNGNHGPGIEDSDSDNSSPSTHPNPSEHQQNTRSPPPQTPPKTEASDTQSEPQPAAQIQAQLGLGLPSQLSFSMTRQWVTPVPSGIHLSAIVDSNDDQEGSNPYSRPITPADPQDSQTAGTSLPAGTSEAITVSN